MTYYRYKTSIQNVIDEIDGVLDGFSDWDNDDDTLYRYLGDAAYEYRTTCMDDYYHAFDDIIREYIFEPTKRIYHFDEISGEWVPTNSCITRFLSYELYQYRPYGRLIGDKSLPDILEILARHPAQEGVEWEFLEMVSTSVGIKTLTDASPLYDWTRNEIIHCYSDYNKHRMTLLCMLMGAVMIAKNTNIHDRPHYLREYVKQWNMLCNFYTVLTGKIVYLGFNHINSVIGHFVSHRPKYAWAMKIALGFSLERLSKGMSPNEKVKLGGYIQKLEQAMREVEQDKSCRNLFNILFPRAEWDSFNNAAPRRSAAETQRMLAEKDYKLNEKDRQLNEKDQMLSEWKLKAEAVEKENVELRPLKKMVEEMRGALDGKMISVDVLCEAILSYPSDVARMLFGNLDWYLDGKDEAWDGMRLRLKQDIQAKEDSERHAATGTTVNAQAYYAAGSQHNDHSRKIALEGANDNDIKKITDDR